MPLDANSLLPLVRGTARLSAVLFTLGTLGFAVRRLGAFRKHFYIGLCASHLAHYTFVFLYVRSTMGSAFLASTHFIVAAAFGALMYSMMIFLAVSAPASVAQPFLSRGRRRLEAICVIALGIAFIVAYSGRTMRDLWFAALLFPVLISLILFVISRRRPAMHSAAAASRNH